MFAFGGLSNKCEFFKGERGWKGGSGTHSISFVSRSFQALILASLPQFVISVSTLLCSLVNFFYFKLHYKNHLTFICSNSLQPMNLNFAGLTLY